MLTIAMVEHRGMLALIRKFEMHEDSEIHEKAGGLVRRLKAFRVVREEEKTEGM